MSWNIDFIQLAKEPRLAENIFEISYKNRLCQENMSALGICCQNKCNH